MKNERQVIIPHNLSPIRELISLIDEIASDAGVSFEYMVERMKEEGIFKVFPRNT